MGKKLLQRVFFHRLSVRNICRASHAIFQGGMLRNVVAQFAAVMLFGLGSVATVFAQTEAPPVQDIAASAKRGAAWLASQVRADGSLENEDLSVATVFQTRAEVAFTLNQFAMPAVSLNTQVASESGSTTEYLARKVLVAASSNQNADLLVQELRNRQNVDGGFAPDTDFSSSVLDTAYALTALALAGYNDQGVVAGGLSYLLTQQKSDGSWAVTEANESSIYLTALAMRAMWHYRAAMNVSAALKKSQTFLLAQLSLQDLHLPVRAEILASVAPTLTDTTMSGASILSLIGQQAADGSWGGAPYDTAVIVRALQKVALPVTNPDLVTIRGRVVDGASNLPLDLAEVSLAGSTVMKVVTSGDGLFEFSGIVAGNYEFSVNRTGYGIVSGALQLQIGQTLDLGTLSLLPVTQATTAVVRGVITDAKTGAAINAAKVTIGSQSVLTGTDGTYQITSIPPSEVTLEASRSGYLSASAKTTLVAGQTVIFSPALVPASSVVTTISGKVTDRDSGAPLVGASVRLTGTNDRNVTTNNSGLYSFTGLNPGDNAITVSASGYAESTAAVMVEPNKTYDFSPSLAKAPTDPTQAKLSLSGYIRDAVTGQPVPDANISLSGPNNAHARTDSSGRYLFADLLAGSHFITASAPEYQPVTLPIALVSGEHTWSKDLYPQGYVDPNGSITGKVVDETSQRPIEGAVVKAELNSTTTLFTLTSANGQFSLPGGLQGEWKVSVGRAGYVELVSDVSIPYGATANMGQLRLKRLSDVVELPDLALSLIDATALVNDPVTFRSEGKVKIHISNIGNASATSPFTIRIYVDLNEDGLFNEGVDTSIGTGRMSTPIGSREFGVAEVSVNYSRAFRDAPFAVMIDSDREVIELNESNNDASSAEIGVCR